MRMESDRDQIEKGLDNKFCSLKVVPEEGHAAFLRTILMSGSN